MSVNQMATFQMTSVASGFGFKSGIKGKGGEQQRKASLKGVDFVSGLEESWAAQSTWSQRHHYMIRENAQRHLWQENAGATQEAELGQKLAQEISNEIHALKFCSWSHQCTNTDLIVKRKEYGQKESKRSEESNAVHLRQWCGATNR